MCVCVCVCVCVCNLEGRGQDKGILTFYSICFVLCESFIKNLYSFACVIKEKKLA